MSKDANDLADEYARRQAAAATEAQRTGISQVRGTLTIWPNLSWVETSSWLTQSLHTVLDLSKPGVLIAYDERGDAEIFYPEPGWYVNFVPDREGE